MEINDNDKQESLAKLKSEISKLRHEKNKFLEYLYKKVEKITGIAPPQSKGMQFYVEKLIYYLENIIANVPTSVYWLNMRNDYLGCCNYTADLIGLNSRYEMAGKRDEDLEAMYDWPPEVIKKFHEANKEVLQGKRVINREELPFMTSSGKEIYQLTNRVPLRDENGKIIGVLGVSFDVTDLKKMEITLKESKEKAEEFNKLKSKFIENMEHDLRTPLSGLEATIASLLHTKKEGIEKQTLEFSLSAVEELKVIINSILDFENQKYGYKVLNEPFNVSHVFESVHRLYHPTANSKHLKLSYSVDPTIPRILISDEWRIKHILINLVGNALKFTHEGEVFFEAKLVRHEDRKVLIEFIVKDTGIGIPDDKREVIFERYVRLEGSNKGRYKGTGLGLANVKEYVEQLGGEFRPIQSEVGKGTTFSILIPMKESLDQAMPLPSDQTKEKADEVEFFYDSEKEKCEAAEIQPTQAQPSNVDETPSTVDATGTTTALLVEDSPPAQFMGKIAIKTAGCEVDTANTAEDALKMLAEKHYDLIFADIGLPGMDGIEMTRHIRYNERKAGKHSIPIIGQTANANAKTKKASIEAGMQDLLAKPLTPTNVSEMLKNYTQRGSEATEPVTAPHVIKSTTIIDHDSLLDIWKNYHNLKDVFNDTKKDTIADIDNFKTAYQQSDWKQFLYLAHKIRGGFLYFAASRAEEAFSYLEAYLNDLKGKEPDKKVLEPLYRMVMTEIDTVLKEINTITRNDLN
jgi:two-component system, OmpR family, aerobic respiration control sensor histidine kinase ArcB